MAMRRNPRTVTKVVGILTDPHPEFVSLVPQGAIQQPLKVVKSTSAVVDIHRITFDKSVFKTADEASAYLAGKGYSDYELTERDGAFVVDGLPEEEFEGDLETITAQKGIIMVVGRTRTRKSAAASAEVSTEVAADSVAGTATETDTVAKGDESLAGAAAADSVVASDAAAPVEGAPADDTIETVERSAETTAFVDGFSTLVTRAAIGDLSEVAYLTRGLVWAAESREYDEALNGAAPGMAERLREIARELIPILQTYATEAVESIAALTQKSVAAEGAASTEQPGTEASAEAAAAEVNPGSEADAPTEAAKETEQPGAGSTDTPVTEGDQTTGAAGEPVAKEPGPMDALAAALQAALSPITAALTELSTKTETALTSMGDQVTKATERVEALEVGENRQTRKSGDIEDVAAPSSPASTPEDAVQAQRARRALRDRVGI